MNDSEKPATIVAVTELSPSVMRQIVSLHLNYYCKNFGFGEKFEQSITKDLVSFSQRLSHRNNRLWLATRNDEILGSLAIDGVSLGDGHAQLRWLILDPSLHSKGFGGSMLSNAIDFCKIHGFCEIHLWTFSDLHGARALYLRHGFGCVEESRGAQWGVEVLEQRYLLSLASQVNHR